MSDSRPPPPAVLWPTVALAVAILVAIVVLAVEHEEEILRPLVTLLIGLLMPSPLVGWPTLAPARSSSSSSSSSSDSSSSSSEEPPR